MHNQSGKEMPEVWRDIIAFGIKPMGSDNLQRTSKYLETVMREVCDKVELCIYPERAWEAVDWGLFDEAENKLDTYLFLESASSEWFEGNVEFAGYHRVWDMYAWKRYKITGHDGKIKAYITLREDADAIPQMLFAKGDLPHYMVGSKDVCRIEEAVKNRSLIKGYAHTQQLPDTYCRNVTGSIGYGNRKIIICAHYDTVYSTVGAYDNAAGTSVVLEVARRLKAYRIKRKIDILLTDGEEFNLRGSRHQAEAENEEVEFVLNIDGVGRESVLEVWSGPEPFERKIRSILDNSMESFEPVYICPPPPGSDHAPYFEKGIDVCMLTFNDQGILHTPEDVYEESKLENMEKMVRIVLELLEEFQIIEAK